MRQSSLFRLLLLALLMMDILFLQAQTLQVELSPDKSKVDRSVNNGTATIFFDSNVNDLSVVCTEAKNEEPIQKIGNKLWFMHVDVKKDMEDDGVCYRNFLLKSPSSAEYYLTTPEIGYNQVLYYTVVMPDRFPVTLSAEYLYTKSSLHGIRVSYGGRIGAYVSYKWGKYFKTGININDFNEDTDVTHASELGYIRNSYIGGVRIGLNHKYIPIYAFVGGGYGEYGRQWQNLTEIDNNIYFYSDYIKGFEGEVGLSCVLYDYLFLSVGMDAVFGRGKVSTDFQLGIGISLNQSKLFKRKKKSNL